MMLSPCALLQRRSHNSQVIAEAITREIEAGHWTGDTNAVVAAAAHEARRAADEAASLGMDALTSIGDAAARLLQPAASGPAFEGRVTLASQQALYGKGAAKEVAKRLSGDFLSSREAGTPEQAIEDDFDEPPARGAAAVDDEADVFAGAASDVSPAIASIDEGYIAPADLLATGAIIANVDFENVGMRGISNDVFGQPNGRERRRAKRLLAAAAAASSEVATGVAKDGAATQALAVAPPTGEATQVASAAEDAAPDASAAEGPSAKGDAAAEAEDGAAAEAEQAAWDAATAETLMAELKAEAATRRPSKKRPAPATPIPPLTPEVHPAARQTGDKTVADEVGSPPALEPSLEPTGHTVVPGAEAPSAKPRAPRAKRESSPEPASDGHAPTAVDASRAERKPRAKRESSPEPASDGHTPAVADTLQAERKPRAKRESSVGLTGTATSLTGMAAKQELPALPATPAPPPPSASSAVRPDGERFATPELDSPAALARLERRVRVARARDLDVAVPALPDADLEAALSGDTLVAQVRGRVEGASMAHAAPLTLPRPLQALAGLPARAARRIGPQREESALRSANGVVAARVQLAEDLRDARVSNLTRVTATYFKATHNLPLMSRRRCCGQRSSRPTARKPRPALSSWPPKSGGPEPLPTSSSRVLWSLPAHLPTRITMGRPLSEGGVAAARVAALRLSTQQVAPATSTLCRLSSAATILLRHPFRVSTRCLLSACASSAAGAAAGTEAPAPAARGGRAAALAGLARALATSTTAATQARTRAASPPAAGGRGEARHAREAGVVAAAAVPTSEGAAERRAAMAASAAMALASVRLPLAAAGVAAPGGAASEAEEAFEELEAAGGEAAAAVVPSLAGEGAFEAEAEAAAMAAARRPLAGAAMRHGARPLGVTAAALCLPHLVSGEGTAAAASRRDGSGLASLWPGGPSPLRRTMPPASKSQ